MDTRRLRTDWTWWLALAVKLSLGSMIGIAIARLLRLEFSGQAGIIAIFTMMTTRKGTLRLSLTRIISFLVSCLIISLAWRVVEDDLPQTREEFENRAVLYHIMMDLEDFLLCKQKFIKYLDRRKRDHN